MTPAPTVRPPSRIANRKPSSIATGVISSISTRTLSPGITISTPSGSATFPGMRVQVTTDEEPGQEREIFAGTKAPVPAQTTIFKSVGLAIEDIAAARLVVDAHQRREHRS